MDFGFQIFHSNHSFLALSQKKLQADGTGTKPMSSPKTSRVLGLSRAINRKGVSISRHRIFTDKESIILITPCFGCCNTAIFHDEFRKLLGFKGRLNLKKDSYGVVL